MKELSVDHLLKRVAACLSGSRKLLLPFPIERGYEIDCDSGYESGYESGCLSQWPIISNLLILGATLVMSGCGDSDPVSGSGSDQNVDTGNILVEQPSGLPEGLRDDVPVYPGMEIADVSAVEDGFELSGSSSSSVAVIGAFYEMAFADQGWMLDEQLSDTTSASARIYEVTKDDRSIAVILVDNGNGSDIEMRTRNAPVYVIDYR